MRIYIFATFLATLCLLCSCSDNSTNTLPLYNDYYFQLQPNEIKAPINYTINETYVSFFNNDTSVSVPLFFAVRHDNYQLFVGLPLSEHFESLKSRKDSMDTAFENSADSTTIFRRGKKDKYFVSAYLSRLDSASVVAIYGLSEDSTIFSKAFFANRIQKEK